MKRKLTALWPGDIKLGDLVAFNGEQSELMRGVAIKVEPIIKGSFGAEIQHVLLSNPSRTGWQEWQLVLSSQASTAFRP